VPRSIRNTKEVFGLNNQSILDEVMHHVFIPQIWWNRLIPHIITNYYTMRNEMAMDELIPIHKLDKKMKTAKMMDYLLTTINLN
jgi:hypothetical protein